MLQADFPERTRSRRPKNHETGRGGAPELNATTPQATRITRVPRSLPLLLLVPAQHLLLPPLRCRDRWFDCCVCAVLGGLIVASLSFFAVPVSLTSALCSPFTTGARGTSTKTSSSFSSKRLIVTSGSAGAIISCGSPRQKPRRSVTAIDPNWQRVKRQAPSAPLLAAGAFVWPRRWRARTPALQQREIHCRNIESMEY